MLVGFDVIKGVSDCVPEQSMSTILVGSVRSHVLVISDIKVVISHVTQLF